MKTEELIELLRSCSEKNCPVCPDIESCTGPSWLLRKAADKLEELVTHTVSNDDFCSRGERK